MICWIHRSSEDIFNADRSIRRLLIKALNLSAVHTVDDFWAFLDRFSRELYRKCMSIVLLIFID